MSSIASAILNGLHQDQKVFYIAVSSTDLSKQVKLFVVEGDDIREITAAAATVTGRKLGNKDGVVVRGSNYNHGEALVEEVALAINKQLKPVRM